MTLARAVGSRAGVVLVHAYQLLLGPFMGGGCRFEPSCSAYAIEAFTQHGFWRGAWLACRRLGRCHPFGHSGIDPVPAAARAAGQRSAR